MFTCTAITRALKNSRKKSLLASANQSDCPPTYTMFLNQGSQDFFLFTGNCFTGCTVKEQALLRESSQFFVFVNIGLNFTNSLLFSFRNFCLFQFRFSQTLDLIVLDTRTHRCKDHSSLRTAATGMLFLSEGFVMHMCSCKNPIRNPVKFIHGQEINKFSSKILMFFCNYFSTVKETRFAFCLHNI